MKVAICVVGRLENRYAVEFIEYHKNLGIDHIFVYDNNYDGEEYFEDVLQLYIDEGYVNVINVRNMKIPQNYCYNDCYNQCHDDYDYLALIDFDEYICLVKDKTIQEYLSRNVDNYDAILLNWKCYGDNELLYDDGRPCIERFTKSCCECMSNYDTDNDGYVKTIINCNSDANFSFSNIHVPNDCNCCNNEFKYKVGRIRGNLLTIFDFTANYHTVNHNLAYIKHFTTKTIDEYINIKLKRGVGDRAYGTFNETYGIEYFYKYNEKTIEKDNYIKHNYSHIALCAIGRLENQYAVEFVEYYKNLGIDHIIIYDNNYDGEEYFEDVLGSYIEDEYVEIINVRNENIIQTTCYTECFFNYKKRYDYIIFLDFDEYLCFTKDKNIKEYLGRNNNDYDCILINWMCYDDNNLITYDNRPMIKRFIHPIKPYNKKLGYDHMNIPENSFVKCIINCKTCVNKNININFNNPHCPNNENITYCNNSFNKNFMSLYKEIYNNMFILDNDGKTINYDLAYIKHFPTKTIEEYLTNKLKRGVGDRDYESFKEHYTIDLFFKFNKRTKEKEEYINNYYNVSNENTI